MKRNHKDIQNKKLIKIIKKEKELNNRDRGSRTYYKKDGIKRVFSVSTRFKKNPLFKALSFILPRITEPGFLIPPKSYFSGTDTQPMILDLDINEFKALTPDQQLCFDILPGSAEEYNMDFSHGPNRPKYVYPKKYTLTQRCKEMLYVKEEVNWVKSWSYYTNSTEEAQLDNYIKNHDIRRKAAKAMSKRYREVYDYNETKKRLKNIDLKQDQEREIKEVW